MQKNSSPKYVNSGVVIIVVIILVEHREILKNFQSRYFGPCTLGSFVFLIYILRLHLKDTFKFLQALWNLGESNPGAWHC